MPLGHISNRMLRIQITFSPGISLLPSRETSAPPPWRPHRTNFTAPLLPNAGDVVLLCRALGRVPLTPRCWSCLDDGRVNYTGADSPPPLFTVPEWLPLRIRLESRRCFPVAVDRRDIVVSLPPVATATAPASPTRQLDLPTSPCRQIGHTLISNHFI